MQILGFSLHHPGGVTGYRLTHQGRSLVIATDVEAGDPAADAALLKLAQHAAVLIHDAQYTPDELAVGKAGWDHSSWEAATTLALTAGVERLVLTSHDPQRNDAGVDGIVASARERFPACEAAYDGMIIDW